MNFNKEKYQFKYNDKDKIVTTIFYQENKENKKNKNNTRAYLGKKRNLFENHNNNFIISKSTTFFIKNKNSESCETHETCIICLNDLSLQNKHFLHCGHIFHCACINYWINNGNNICPICRQNIKCNYEEYVLINLDEDEDENNNNHNDNDNDRIIRNNHRIIRNNICDELIDLIKIIKYIFVIYAFYLFGRNKYIKNILIFWVFIYYALYYLIILLFYFFYFL